MNHLNVKVPTTPPTKVDILKMNNLNIHNTGVIYTPQKIWLIHAFPSRCNLDTELDEIIKLRSHPDAFTNNKEQPYVPLLHENSASGHFIITTGSHVADVHVDPSSLLLLGKTRVRLVIEDIVECFICKTIVFALHSLFSNKLILFFQFVDGTKIYKSINLLDEYNGFCVVLYKQELEMINIERILPGCAKKRNIPSRAHSKKNKPIEQTRNRLVLSQKITCDFTCVHQRMSHLNSWLRHT